MKNREDYGSHFLYWSSDSMTGTGSEFALAYDHLLLAPSFRHRAEQY